MKDRLPAYGMANRVKITQDDGNIVEGVLSYADGATQEGSAYNKANVLPDSICKALGLSVESEPKDVFGVLADCGDLHVWRKKVVVADKIPAIPAGYTIGELVNLNLTVGIPINYGKSGEWEYVTDVSSISVSDDGSVRFNNAKSFSISDGPIGYDISEVNILKGKYVRCTKLPEGWLSEGIEPSAPPSVGNVYYFPNDTAFIKKEFSTGIEHNGEMVNFFEIMATKYKEVTGYPYTPEVPAGTTTTYPVSTNPKAYQEGDDAKPAGYTLGEVVTGKFRMGDLAPSNAYEYEYAAGITVDENGTVSLQNPSEFSINSESHQGYESTISSLISGKFLRYKGRDSSYGGSDAPDTQHPFDATPSVIIYIPADVVVTSTSTWPAGFYLDKYQPVTSYAAIPAGTTIEYLGKLGDKARVQVLSYVGTGVYGESNPNSLTFNFAPKIVKFLFQVEVGIGNHSKIENFQQDGEQYYMVSDRLTTEFAQGEGFGYNSYAVRGKKSADGKTFTWYTGIGSQAQGNQKGMKYYFIAFG